MITLSDTFNGHEISRHRTMKAAVKAQRAHLAAVRKANGSNSYLTYGFHENGEPANPGDVEAAKLELDGM